MTNTANEHDRRSRRAVVRDGVLALVALFVVGALVMVPSIQRHLGRDANAALAQAGFDARIDFHGQDGTLRCADQLDDPAAAQAVAAQVKGVRSVAVDVSCLEPAATVAPDTTTVSPTTTVPTTLAPTTSMAPAPSTTEGSTSTTTPDPVVDAVATVELVEGRLSLSGSVSTRTQRAQLLDTAKFAVGDSNVDLQMTVDRTAGVDDATIGTLAQLVAAMVAPLVDGTVGWGPNGVFVTGTVTDATSMTAFSNAVVDAGGRAELQLRPAAIATDAAAMQDALNAMVAAEPFVFAKGGITVAPEQYALLHRVAGLAKRFAGVTVEVQGYTDSEGDPGRNLTLSEQRAKAVADALVAVGVPSANITSRGFGETGLITDDNGVEIPEKSRRVVFGVTVSN